MSKAPRKLILTRETLLPLHQRELGAIHGGTTPAVPIVGEEASVAAWAASVRFCSAVSAAISGQAQGSFGGVKKAIHTAKQAGGWVKKHLPHF